ncbi:transcriptional regulator, MerR family [Marvinbryantia formatexigens DSM 14469]|uniref:Transcriptional regulator, MerR family n=1 Tax=Marvinbryantia formatexigens DSM 14469 TaxID=478749 RepID=C6LJL4_9FIRM|nr:MerR family transcriptional regulator [Marvinbryantia formatexigens]EET59137.1 transcriptional regulator, MerR family [Marvinbryantia formatexigens DSM 14469]UWO26244.1 MerR family transcriptional regulator [Marvinbryantia formatexigens DSM 14469]SDG11074.1 DNA-binding transcriptional regulator, MerR family [Marvinbryantia formatexigens]
MKIQQVEELVGITKKNIRFYEHEGLLSPKRSENGYRDYTQEDVETLRKIKLLRSLSFPLEEIRRLQAGVLTMEDGARRHIIVLEREQASLEKAQCLCREMQEHGETLDTLDAGLYLEKMKHMEKEGAVFMDVKKQDHRRDYIAPAAASVIIVLFIGIVLFFMITESMKERLSTGEFLFIAAMAAMLLAVIVGVLLALWQRIKQIKGGEEDAASKY